MKGNVFNLKRGDKILAVSIYHTTYSSYGSNDKMRRIFKNQDVMDCHSVSEKTVSAGGWTWHIQDIRPASYKDKKEEKIEPVHFNIKELVL